MKLRAPQRKDSGFTIIEVMIVLAIAGVILLMVFLAIPALQRNNRNTQIKNDAAAVLGAVTEWSNNNNGSIPAYVCTIPNTTTGEVYIAGTGSCPTAASAAAVSANIRGTTIVQSQAASVAATSVAWPTTTDTISIALQKTCTSNTAVAANTRAVAAVFRVETAGSTAQQCTDS